MHRQTVLLSTGPLSYLRTGTVFLCLALLLGCQPNVPAPTPPLPQAGSVDVTPIANPTPPSAEVQPPATEGTKPPSSSPEAKPAAKNDPLKDVVPPGPVVPYFNPLSEAEITSGWISLFDGHSLFGWESNAPAVNWAVADGTITADAGPKGLLLTYTPFADYQFRCDYRMAAGGNSGVFLRTLREPTDVLKDCYEVNIVDEHPEGFLTGSIVGLQKTAAPIKGSGDWHTLLLAANGTKITIAIDGNLVCTYDDARPEARKSGLIGLQKNAGQIEFKNIALQPLNQKPLFNGTDLTGWRIVPGSKGEFTVAEGTIHVKGGEGFLETESQHKDFVFQAHVKTSGEWVLDGTISRSVNTGIFFRAETGTEKAKSNGYEMQIDNSSQELNTDIPFRPKVFPQVDKAVPANAGTGAIFRRINARHLVSRDGVWTPVTLIASGPRFSTYVNGYAVVHWEDTRKPDPNPRKGQRLDAGHFSLQGHDPTTDASFKAITISDLP